MSVAISRSLTARLLAEAAAAPAVETCGLLFGDETAITSARPARNVATDPGTAFEIDPALLLAAHRAARIGGPRIVGCYHSHPAGDATPSSRDAAAAEPGALWLLLGRGEARLWRARDGGFEPVAIDPR